LDERTNIFFFCQMPGWVGYLSFSSRSVLFRSPINILPCLLTPAAAAAWFTKENKTSHSVFQPLQRLQLLQPCRTEGKLFLGRAALPRLAAGMTYWAEKHGKLRHGRLFFAERASCWAPPPVLRLRLRLTPRLFSLHRHRHSCSSRQNSPFCSKMTVTAFSRWVITCGLPCCTLDVSQ